MDPLGLVHVCQGITIGNAFETPLDEILQRYDPTSHAIVGPLLRGGPADEPPVVLARHPATPEALCGAGEGTRALETSLQEAAQLPEGSARFSHHGVQ